MTTALIFIVVLLGSIWYAYKKGGDHREAKMLAKQTINVLETERAISDEMDKRQSGRKRIDNLSDADSMWSEGDPTATPETPAKDRKTDPDVG